MDQRRTRPAIWPFPHHTNPEAEFTFDGGATKAVYEVRVKDWTVVDMKHERKVISPPEKRGG